MLYSPCSQSGRLPPALPASLIDAYLNRARKEATSTVIDLVGEEICDLIGEAARKAALATIQAAFDEYENHEYEKLGRRPADEDAIN